MKNKLTLFVVIQAILIVILIWLLTYLGRDEFKNANDQNEAKKSNAYIKKKNDMDKAIISKNEQTNSSIKTDKIKPETNDKTITHYDNI